MKVVTWMPRKSKQVMRKAADCKDVKTKPCEYLGEATKATSHGDLKLVCKAAIKSEPLEN